MVSCNLAIWDLPNKEPCCQLHAHFWKVLSLRFCCGQRSLHGCMLTDGQYRAKRKEVHEATLFPANLQIELRSITSCKQSFSHQHNSTIIHQVLQRSQIIPIQTNCLVPNPRPSRKVHAWTCLRWGRLPVPATVPSCNNALELFLAVYAHNNPHRLRMLSM